MLVEVELEMLVFMEGGKPEKNPWGRDEDKQQTQNQTRAYTLVGGERSLSLLHHPMT